ncbi:MAG: substrate-binding domain-containing protein [Peptoclostridium sp.]|uniref:sugar ABC transporter substrate-binding protein n=1 Tax=Peptoclostridium sp. TaxID=1904860 RepID=UPI00139D1144|nr:substrate-binding domain-containing protein [Peptoclostridium sp.]MZQ75878.1 substrate-binding domain-containing protein [Peptoclostridium sp.]
MKNAKRLIAAFLAATMMFSMAGCSAKQEAKTAEPKSTTQETQKNSAFADAEKKLEEALAPLPAKDSKAKLAALEITLANPFWVTMKEGYESAAAEYGVTIDVLAAPKEDDVNSQLETLKTLLSKDYNAIAISAITPFNLVPGVAEATKKGIPVVAVGTSVDAEEAKKVNAKIEAFITSDFEEQGKMGAEFIAEKIGSGKVAIIEGLPGAAQGEARKSGAQKGFEGKDGIEVVSVQPGNWDRKTAYDITTNLLQANPDLKGIFCANDMMALGAVEALKAANKKDQVVVVGVDFIEEAKASIAKGELDATVAMSPYLFGKGGLIIALKVLEGQTIDKDIYWTPLGLVTKDNVDSFEGWK